SRGRRGPLEFVDPAKMDGLQVECQVGGIFLFAPMIERFKIPGLVTKAKLPKSPQIPALSYVMSMLALKLVGKERLAQINDFNFDRGFGLFAGLNVMPKSTAISTYSYRLEQRHIGRVMKHFVEGQNKSKTYGSGTINIDFHTMQHYGDDSVLEEHWSGSRAKRVKGALTFIAQDCDSRCQLYVNSDIQRSEADDEILEFVKFWRGIRGKFKQTLVFDSKLTTYTNLKTLADDKVTFITLRRRGKNLVRDALALPREAWKRITLDSPRRKYANPLIHDSMVKLDDTYGLIRQIIMTDNGREDPAFFITNNVSASAKEIVEQYAKRWNIENSIDEAVQFFNLNALSSPILIKIHFDVVLTMMADTLYYHLAQDLRGFEACEAAKLFHKFVNMPAKIVVRPDEIVVAFPLRATSPVLRSAKLDRACPPISWLGNRKLRFLWGEKVNP
ncbi:MAG: transposase, partial [Bdellovibrionota bacterium]